MMDRLAASTRSVGAARKKQSDIVAVSQPTNLSCLCLCEPSEKWTKLCQQRGKLFPLSAEEDNGAAKPRNAKSKGLQLCTCSRSRVLPD